MSKDNSKPTLQSQMTALDEILAWFDKPDIDLDQALGKFEEGVQLADKINKQLADLENKITVLKQKFDQSL